MFANGPGDLGSILKQRLKKWFLMPPCLTRRMLKFVSRVKWNNPGNGVAPSPIPSSSYKSYYSSSSTVFANGPQDLGSIPLQRLKKGLLMTPCLTLRILKYVSRVKWSNPGNGVAPSPTPRCSSYWKGSFPVALDNGLQYIFFIISVRFGLKFCWISS